MKYGFLIIFLVLGLCLNTAGTSQAIVIDGNFNDWSGISVLMTDPAGDIPTGGSATVDWENLWVTNDATSVYFCYDIVGSVNFGYDWKYNLLLDTDQNINTGFSYALQATIGADYLIQGPQLYTHTGTGNQWTWDLASMQWQEYFINADKVEIKVAQTSLSSPQAFDLQLYSDDWIYSDWTSEAAYTLPEANSLILFSSGLVGLILFGKRGRFLKKKKI